MFITTKTNSILSLFFTPPSESKQMNKHVWCFSCCETVQTTHVHESAAFPWVDESHQTSSFSIPFLCCFWYQFFCTFPIMFHSTSKCTAFRKHHHGFCIPTFHTFFKKSHSFPLVFVCFSFPCQSSCQLSLCFHISSACCSDQFHFTPLLDTYLVRHVCLCVCGVLVKKKKRKEKNSIRNQKRLFWTLFLCVLFDVSLTLNNTTLFHCLNVECVYIKSWDCWEQSNTKNFHSLFEKEKGWICFWGWKTLGRNERERMSMWECVFSANGVLLSRERNSNKKRKFLKA